MKDLTQSRLFEVYHYNPVNGKFTPRRGGQPPSGKRRGRGSKESTGYLRMMIDRQRYFAHRLAFLYMTGSFPDGVVDHINGVKTDNRWSNLRALSNAENIQNQKRRHADKASGLPLGVTKRFNKYRFCLTINKLKFERSGFSSAEEAHLAYIETKRLFSISNTL